MTVEMGLEAVYPKPSLSDSRVGYRIYPNLLTDVEIDRVNQVWRRGYYLRSTLAGV